MFNHFEMSVTGSSCSDVAAAVEHWQDVTTQQHTINHCS